MREAVDAWLRADPVARVRLVAAALTLLTTGPAIAMAIYLWRIGRRVISVDRYPPPGVHLLRETRSVTGPAARRIGRLMQWLAVTLGLAGVLLAVFLWAILATLRLVR
jgi:hypothetical protein